MRLLQTDLSIFKKFNFENPPVGIKFEFHKPKGIEQIDKDLAFCEMIKEAQGKETPFYFTKQNESCFGKICLGMIDPPSIVESGHLGVKLDIFQDARANNNIYQYISKFEKGTVNYVLLSKLDKLTFEPDILVVMANTSQAEIILRAMSYSTGEIWESKKTGVLGCSWMFVYPYKSGKINYTTTGLAFGMKVHNVFPEGWTLISIPYQWIPTITRNLQEMNWVPSSYTDTREEYLQREKRILEELEQESRNP
ncbi:MAG: DUF169 domain-containing protein [Spirochaetes bacterium]|nr:DUF169 domain-containing protein [Spirochaetota bacterium]